MDFTPDEGQQAVADVVTSALGRDNSWQALVDGGVIAFGVPERLGGDGLGLPEIATALTEIGRHGTVSPALATLGLGLVPLIDLASVEQQDRFLAGVTKGGVQIKKGQRVVLSYRSANFDETVFDDPNTFNILRDPNPHVGFGGTGAHFCIGANLARMTINLIFNAVADNMPDLKPVGEPERLKSGWLNGIKHWQVDYTGAGEPAIQR